MWPCILSSLSLCLLINSAASQVRTQLITPQSLSSAPEPPPVAQPDGIGHLHPHHPARSPELICPSCLDARLTQHYLVRGCRPVILGQCKCPSRFKCPVDLPASRPKSAHRSRSISPTTEGRSMRLTEWGDIKSDGCWYNSTHYLLGQIVPTADVCRICVCGYHFDGTVGVDCETQIQCPATRAAMPQTPVMWMQNRAGQLVGSFISRTVGSALSQVRLKCYEFYEHDKCCPRQECVPVNARTGRTLRDRKTCRYGKRLYQIGEKIDIQSMLNEELPDLEAEESEKMFSLSEETLDEGTGISTRLRRNQFPPNFPEEAACLSCICTEGWNNSVLEQGLDKLSMELFLNEMGHSCRRKRCEMELDPRFKAGCLPVYHEDKCCPVDFICPRTRYMSMRVRGLDFGSKLCKFEGRKYPVGSMLYQMDHSAAPCVDCECRIPPDFTCLQRKHCITNPDPSDKVRRQL